MATLIFFQLLIDQVFDFLLETTPETQDLIEHRIDCELDEEREFKIMYPFALDKSGKVVFILNATNKEKYSCLDCKEEMRSRALTSKMRTPHFYHKNGLKNCEESYEHLQGKKMIASMLESHLKNNSELVIVDWSHHEYGCIRLLKGVTEVQLEKII